MPSPGGLAAVAAHLAQRRPAILQAWRDAVTSDPTLTTGSSLPIAQLHDHLPALLADFERKLASLEPAESAESREVLSDVLDGDAAAHGLHRCPDRGAGGAGWSMEREQIRFLLYIVKETNDYEPSLSRPERAAGNVPEVL